jgi:hypothetical protein
LITETVDTESVDTGAHLYILSNHKTAMKIILR